jgi:hypothetical protein
MRWLLICLLVSVGALLLAAAGVARHIWRHHRGSASGSASTKTRKHIENGVAVDEVDVEPEV